MDYERQGSVVLSQPKGLLALLNDAVLSLVDLFRARDIENCLPKIRTTNLYIAGFLDREIRGKPGAGLLTFARPVTVSSRLQRAKQGEENKVSNELPR